MFRRSKQQGMQPPVKSKVLLLVSLSLGLLCLLAVIGYFVLNNAQNTPQEKPKSLAIDFDAKSKTEMLKRLSKSTVSHLTRRIKK